MYLCDEYLSLQLLWCEFISDMKIYLIIKICNVDKSITAIEFISALKIYHFENSLSLWRKVITVMIHYNNDERYNFNNWWLYGYVGNLYLWCKFISVRKFSILMNIFGKFSIVMKIYFSGDKLTIFMKVIT